MRNAVLLLSLLVIFVLILLVIIVHFVIVVDIVFVAATAFLRDDARGPEKRARGWDLALGVQCVTNREAAVHTNRSNTRGTSCTSRGRGTAA